MCDVRFDLSIIYLWPLSTIWFLMVLFPWLLVWLYIAWYAHCVPIYKHYCPTKITSIYPSIYIYIYCWWYIPLSPMNIQLCLCINPHVHGYPEFLHEYWLNPQIMDKSWQVHHEFPQNTSKLPETLQGMGGAMDLVSADSKVLVVWSPAAPRRARNVEI